MDREDKKRQRLNRLYGNEKSEAEKPDLAWFKIVICLFLYGITIFLQFRLIFVANLAGVIAQIQVMISVFLVVAVKRKGYITAVIINLLVSVFVFVHFWIAGNMDALPGIFVPICTIITLSIIYYFEKKLDSRLGEVSKQKEEIASLYNELTFAEKKIIKQNLQIKESTHKMKAREVRLNYFSYVDVLTELPNREMLFKKLNQLIEENREKQGIFGVVFFDLDHFKRINNSWGYRTGDLLLKRVVERMKKAMNQEDILCRLGSDEFALLIPRPLKQQEIRGYAENLVKCLKESFIIENAELKISASFGISMYPKDGNDAAELLKSADLAMEKSKEQGKLSLILEAD
jgi:diguanylate cyclase (GGDEF)-like protein